MNGTSLDRFKAKREFWIECFSGKDRNSILNQIYQMVWNAAVFKVIIEARKYPARNQEGKSEINVMLNNFIDECFIDSQFSVIRRLTDKAYKLDDPIKGISSLGALLIDIRKNSFLMTRKNMFDVDGLEYDYETSRQREAAYHQTKREVGISTYSVPYEIISNSVKKRHEELDILCGVNANQRNPSDCIREHVIDFLIKKIENATQKIVNYVNKFLSHAATPGSRERDNAKVVEVTLNQFWDAHKVICQVTNFVSKYLLSGTSNSFLPVPQFNHLEFIDKSLVATENVDSLRSVWDEFQRETDSWSLLDMNDFNKEISELK